MRTTGLVETSFVVSIVNLGHCQTHSKQVPDFSRPSGSDLITWASFHHKLTHIASLQFLPSGQYGMCFGCCFSGPLPLRSHKGQVTFLEPFPGVPSHLDQTQKLAKSILALKLSVTTTLSCAVKSPYLLCAIIQ